MKPDRAIKELEDLHQVGLNRLTPSEKKAVKLGEEALERLEFCRIKGEIFSLRLLPSETTE